MLIPPPPDLRPTIIQMQNINEDESDQSASATPILNPTNSALIQSSNNVNGVMGNANVKRKRRRSSSSLVSQNEIEKRKREHKTAHSIIEKKRRIKMNREFEALKYIIPACRNNFNSSNNNGESMYKLTILQATVDYIKYLHEVINIQKNELISSNTIDRDWSLETDFDFASFNVDTESYRDLNNNFDFNKLFENFQASRKNSSSNLNLSPNSSGNQNPPVHFDTPALQSKNHLQSIRRNSNASDLSELPSPIIAPEIYDSSSSSSSTTSSSSAKTNTNSYINPEFQFPKPKPNPARNNSSLQDFQLPISSLSSEKLNIIHETSEAHATNALLSMKKDKSVTSIKSLLNE